MACSHSLSHFQKLIRVSEWTEINFWTKIKMTVDKVQNKA